MERHPYFDLWLHDTPELSDILGAGVVERRTIHDWPLSCVQLLRLVDGRKLIYKSQLSASSVEPEFYAALHAWTQKQPEPCHSLLPAAQVLCKLNNSIGMIFEFIQAPRLEELQLSEAEIVAHGRRLQEIMGRLPADLPVYIDISTAERWLTFSDETFSFLQELVRTSAFHMVTMATVQRLFNWSRSEAVNYTLQKPPTLSHGDLCGDNIFVCPEGYKIIDWQRPVRGPSQLDLAVFLFGMGLEPAHYLPGVIIEINLFLHLRWFTEAKLYWFPEGDTYDTQVAELARLILKN
jgi:hypothetical protein